MDDTPRWRGQRDKRAWRFWSFIGVSVALHGTLTPWVAMLGLLGLLSAPEDEGPALPPIVAIPVELLDAPVAAEAQQVEQEAVPPAAPVVTTEQSAEEAPAEPVPAAPPPDKPPQPERPPSEAEQDASLGNPVALSGASKLADTGANVSLLIDTAKIRSQPLGAKVGEIMRNIPQWRDFFGPTGLDPVRDVDQVLVAGPQLRDSSEVVAVVKYNVEESVVLEAVGVLVERSGGAWVDGPMKAARARADRAPRTFVFLAPGIVAVVPPSAEASTLAMRRGSVTLKGLPGDQVLIASVKTPKNVFKGLSLDLHFPESIESMTISVAPAPEGGLVARINGVDVDHESATQHAGALERDVLAVTAPPGFIGRTVLFNLFKVDRLVDHLALQAEDHHIVGELRLTQQQIEGILGFAFNRFVPPPPSSPRPATSASSAAPGAAPSTGALVPTPTSSAVAFPKTSAPGSSATPAASPPP